VLVGVLAGFLAGLFGVGGGILIVPGLVLVVGMPQRLAHGTSLAAVVPISVASLVTYVVHDNVDWPVALCLAIGAVGGAVIGTRLLTVLPVRTITVLFVILLLATAARLFIDVDATGRSALDVTSALVLVGVGLAAGILAGLLGVGGGIIVVPAMILLLGIDPTVAKGTSAAMIIPTALMGTWRNRRSANADLHVAWVIGLAGIVTAALGAILADRLDDDLSNFLFAILLLLVAIRLTWPLIRRRPAEDATPSEGAAPRHR
jgi:uncharacterized membrane protein YfcA